MVGFETLNREIYEDVVEECVAAIFVFGVEENERVRMRLKKKKEVRANPI